MYNVTIETVTAAEDKVRQALLELAKQYAMAALRIAVEVPEALNAIQEYTFKAGAVLDLVDVMPS